jgi:hypothetical protein
LLVSHRKKFIYLKTKKTAGTSVESFFEPYCMPEGQWQQLHYRDEYISESGIIGYRGQARPDRTYYNHLSAAALRSLVGDAVWSDYFKFTVIRNPFDKMVSAFYHLEKSRNPEIYANHPESDVVLFRQWLKSSKGIIDRAVYCIDDEVVVDDFIRYEHLHADIKRICDKLNVDCDLNRLPNFKSQYRDRSIPLHEFYDAESVSVIAGRYKKELALFNYTLEGLY